MGYKMKTVTWNNRTVGSYFISIKDECSKLLRKGNAEVNVENC